MVGGQVIVEDGLWVLAERLGLEVVFGAVGGGGRRGAGRCEEREENGDGLGEHGDGLIGICGVLAGRWDLRCDEVEVFVSG